MKKVFLVEIEYEELPENKYAHVLYDEGLVVTLENMMEGYIEAGSIRRGYLVGVQQVEEDINGI